MKTSKGVYPRMIKDKAPKPQTFRTYAPRYQSYKGYHLDCSTKQIKATFRFGPLFPHMPKSFVWNSGDLPSAYAYIDAWYAGLNERTIEAERNGSVSAVAIGHGEDEEKVQVMRVNIKQFVQALKLTKSFLIPLWTKLEFISDGAYLVPADYIACMKDLAPDEFGGYASTGWGRAPKAALEELVREQTQAVARGPAVVAAAATPEAEAVEGDDAGPPREITLDRVNAGTHIELLTRTTPGRGRAYYTKRILSGRKLVYSATAWSEHGPWKVWSRDVGALLSLDIDI